MTGAGWWCVEAVSGLLESREREAVLGDLAEAGETAWLGFVAVLGLAMRRQAMLWASWRPWLAAIGLALPNSFQLLGFSVTVTGLAGQMFGGELGAHGVRLVLCKLTLLGIVAWSCGFVVGTISRKTIWASAVACLLPCLFCCSRFAVPHQSWLSLLLFVPFAVWGAWLGRRRLRLGMNAALTLAVGATVLAVSGLILSGDLRRWIGLLALLWPAWFTAVASSSRRPAKEPST